MAVVGRVHARIQDAETRTVKVTADAGKQVRLIGCVNHYLQSLARERLACAHHRLGRAHMARKVARVPGNVGSLVAHEIAHIQRGPQRLVGLEGQGVQGQQHQRFALAGFDFGGCVGGAATQCAQGGAVQVFQQLAFPGVPDLGAGAADVGHREQVQRCQVALVAHAARKGGNHVGIAQVFLLGEAAHAQMFADQKLDKLGVFAVHAVVTAKAAHFHGANLRMVAAAALADIVEQRGDVQNPWFVPAGC